MTEREICFLDMDGVLVDFVGGCIKAHKKTNPYLWADSKGVFDIEKLWGISTQEFWEPLGESGFWYNLNPTQEASQIVQTLEERFGQKNICILTAPSMSGFCIPEKRDWVLRYFPQFKNQILFGGCKQFLAGPNRFLVDDRDKNLKTFQAWGGKSVCVPRDWNSKYVYKDIVLQYLRDHLDLSREV